VDRFLWFIVGFFAGFPCGFLLVFPVLAVSELFGQIAIRGFDSIILLGVRSALTTCILLAPPAIPLWRRKKARNFIIGLTISSSITVFVLTILLIIFIASAIAPGL